MTAFCWVSESSESFPLPQCLEQAYFHGLALHLEAQEDDVNQLPVKPCLPAYLCGAEVTSVLCHHIASYMVIWLVLRFSLLRYHPSSRLSQVYSGSAQTSSLP